MAEQRFVVYTLPVQNLKSKRAPRMLIGPRSIIKGYIYPFVQFEVIVGLQDAFPAVMGEFAVADQNSQPADIVEISLR